VVAGGDGHDPVAADPGRVAAIPLGVVVAAFEDDEVLGHCRHLAFHGGGDAVDRDADVRAVGREDVKARAPRGELVQVDADLVSHVSPVGVARPRGRPR
jgi:hypothetical protein